MPGISQITKLIAVLKNKKLELVQECEIPLEFFPDMIELQIGSAERQFFRIGITDGKAFYREGVSYRIRG